MMNLDAPMPAPLVADSVHTNTNVAANPTSVDWVAAGAVTGVKDQGNCGSCWAFSTTGCLEGIYKIKKGSLISFSEQELVDCDKKGGDLGCNGGLMDNAFTWIKNNGGLCPGSQYPYTSGTTGKRGDCQMSSCTNVAGSGVTSFTDVTANSEAALETAVARNQCPWLSMLVVLLSRATSLVCLLVHVAPASTTVCSLLVTVLTAQAA